MSAPLLPARLAPRPIRCAYGDPPYPGRARRYHIEGTPEYHADALRWDDPEEHVALMHRMEAENPDGWALSTASDALGLLLPGAPKGTRVAGWGKASSGQLGRFRVAFAWEPVLYRVDCGTNLRDGRPCALDWIVAGVGHNSDVEGRFLGAKPRRFCFWLFSLLGLGGHPDDELVDLFPGSGAVGNAWDEWRARPHKTRAGHLQLALEFPPEEDWT